MAFLRKSVVVAKSLLTAKCLTQRGNNFSSATFELPEYKLHLLQSGPELTTTISKEEGLKMYYDMSIIRRIENTASQLYKDRHVRGFLHLYVAQEACCVGIKSVMNPGDCVTTAYRCHGWAYMCGIAARAILAELMGKVTGCSRGKGGSMHLYSPLFLGGNGIVGAHVPVGTGMAFAYKYLNKDNVSVVLYGDGAANQGQVFESYNLAKLHSLPVVYICENNKFGMGTKAEGSSANTKYYTRCEYIPGLWVDGMNVLSMREGMKFALDYCRKGNGPFLMEADTYRYLGHSMSDPGTSYRTREEVKAIRETRDAIMSLKEKLIAGKLATEEECKAIEKKVKEEVEEAAKQALDDKFSPTEELVADVYSNPIRNITRGVAPWDMHPVKNVGKPINTT